MKWPEMTEGLANMLGALLVVIGLGVVLFLAFRESGQARELRDRAEQAEARQNLLETVSPLWPYTKTPVAVIECDITASKNGHCDRYVVYRLTSTE